MACLFKLWLKKPLIFFCLLTISNSLFAKTPSALLNASMHKLVVTDTLLNDTTIYLKAYKQPEYPEGAAALITFLGKNIRYPQLMMEGEIEGKVTVQFIVEKDGRLTNVKALKGPGRGSLEEAVRVVKKLPKWTPGYNQSGQPIRVQYQLPVIFALKESDKKSNNSFKVSVQ
jgi:TonB family protein